MIEFTDDQGQDAFLLGIKPPFGLADVIRKLIYVGVIMVGICIKIY
jgi:hypothetical protein